MLNLFSDVRYSLRVLSKYRSFTAVAVLTLALGIGADTAIFSMADAIMFRPFPFKNLDRIVTLWETIPKVSAERFGVSPANFLSKQELLKLCAAIPANFQLLELMHSALAGFRSEMNFFQTK